MLASQRYTSTGAIADIAVIARHRRDRKTKDLTMDN